jgi:hypothetical protein
MNTRSLPVTGRWSIRSYTASLTDFIIGYRIIRIFPDTNATRIELFYYLFIETRRFKYPFSTTYFFLKNPKYDYGSLHHEWHMGS